MAEAEQLHPPGAVEAVFKRFLDKTLHGQLDQLQSRLEDWRLRIDEHKTEVSSQLAELDALNRHLEHAAAAVLTTPVSSAVPRHLVRLTSLQVHEAWVIVSLENTQLFDLSDLTLRFNCSAHQLQSEVLETTGADQEVSRILEGKQIQPFWTYLPTLEAGLTYEVAVVAEALQVSNTLQLRA